MGDSSGAATFLEHANYPRQDRNDVETDSLGKESSEVFYHEILPAITARSFHAQMAMRGVSMSQRGKRNVCLYVFPSEGTTGPVKLIIGIKFPTAYSVPQN